MNVWTFTGRLGADAELRTTQSGEKVLGFRVANDVGFGDRKTTQWVDCSLWGRRGEALEPHMNKGTQVVISGEVTIREFEKRDGTRGAGLAVRVAEVSLVGGRQDGDGGGHREERRDDRGGYGGGGYGARDREPPRSEGAYGGGSRRPPGDLDDEIPFAPCIH